MAQSPDNLIWIDLEMTGLEPDTDYIIEMAVIITDSELNTIAESPVLTVHQHNEVLARMDEWNTNQHGRSGLTDRVKRSSMSEKEAEEMMLDFIKQYVPAKCSPMCGNTICQDRRFLARHMPVLNDYFHYRQIDVSSIKELAERWSPEVAGFYKEPTHLAMNDVRDSIAELKYYRQAVFKI